MPKIILEAERHFGIGVYETAIVEVPGDLVTCEASATRIDWPSGNKCIELKVWVNHHHKHLKWYPLVGFKASGGGIAPFSSVRRKMKPERIKQVKVIFEILRPITTEIAVEFT